MIIGDVRFSHTVGVRAAALMAACSVVAGGCGQSETLNVEKIMATFDSLRVEARIPGLAVAVLIDSEILALSGLGHADLETQAPVGPDTPFDIASVTKPIAATLALILQDQGALDLDAPMSGFDGFSDLCTDAKAAGGIFFDDWACDDATLTLRHLLSMTANGTPGERFYYNPVSYSWASRPMAQATGTPFSDLVTHLILEPAGMTRSARIHRNLPLRPDLAKALATPYHLGEDGTPQRSTQPSPQGDGAAGGVISTVRDLAAFDVALDDGRLLEPGPRSEMWTPLAPNIPYGLGWFVATLSGEPVVWHTGLWEGAYSALYLKVPARQATLILLANSDGLRWDSRLDEAALERSPFARAFLESVPKR